MVKSYVKILCLIFVFSQLGCYSDDDSSPSAAVEEHHPIVAEPIEPEKVEQTQFTIIHIKNFSAFKKLNDSLGDTRTELILKLNRRDRKHIRKNDSLVIPVEFDEDRLSPFPTFVETIKDIPKIILISRRVQALGAFEYGRLVHWAPTSTGKRSTPTPTGLFHANWKEELRISSVDSTWLMPWCVNISRSGVAIHAYGVPGYPASHSCVRLPEEDAQWIFYWVDLRRTSKGKIVDYGTPVIIFDSYAFGQRQPWRRLPQDPAADKVALAALDSAISSHIPTILAQLAKASSDTLLASNDAL